MNEVAAITGRLQGQTHVMPVRIYWEDTDAGGVVYHASYVRFMERGRTELLRALGLDQGRLMAETGITFVVRRMEIDFLRTGLIDDLAEIETSVKRLGGASLTLDQKVTRTGQSLAEAVVTVVAIRDHRPIRIPDRVRALFADPASAPSGS